MKSLLLALLLLEAIPGATHCQALPLWARSVTPDAAVTREVDAIAPDSLASFCIASSVDHPDERELRLQAVHRAPTDLNPHCPGGAVLLVRPACVFTLSEFMELKGNASTIVLICRPRAIGIVITVRGVGERIS